MLACGGKHQRNTLHVQLTGKGCAAIKDWAALRAWLERMQAKITRLDLAHDDLDGQTVNIEICKQWLQEGLFSCGKAPPARQLVDDLGSGKGSTLYIGKRANGKMFRGYEKGKQLGDPTSKWFRVEVGWRAKDRVIPFDALTEPGKYLAGSFPALAFLSVVQEKIRTLRACATVTVAQAVSNAQQLAGKLINVLVTHLHWSPQKVIRALRRDGIPGRLLPFEKYLASAEVP